MSDQLAGWIEQEEYDDDAVYRLRRVLHDEISILTGRGDVIEGPGGTQLVDGHVNDVEQWVDRRSRWGNPFKIKSDGGEYRRYESVDLYRGWFQGHVERGEWDPKQLRGSVLGCWCLPDMCHGVIILNYLAETHDPQQRLVTDGGRASDGAGRNALNEIPLADWCSLCGQGYSPNLVITIADEPNDGEYRWCHDQCKHDHNRIFLDAFGGGDRRPPDTETASGDDLRTDGGQDTDGAERNTEDWYEHQQTEIDGAKEDIEDRLAHISGRVRDGMLDGELLNEHQNSRLQAYLEGYSDALAYSKTRVERIDNLMRYVESEADDAGGDQQ